MNGISEEHNSWHYYTVHINLGEFGQFLELFTPLQCYQWFWVPCENSLCKMIRSNRRKCGNNFCKRNEGRGKVRREGRKKRDMLLLFPMDLRETKRNAKEIEYSRKIEGENEVNTGDGNI
jgi:hypothetical protein